MYYKRKTVLELTEKVYITKAAKEKLKQLKRKQKKSMAQIVIDLIIKEYEKVFRNPR